MSCRPRPGYVNFALHREVLNRAAFHVTEQAVVSGGGAGDLQVHYRIALSVKGTGVTGGISLTDRRPLLASQINVPGQYRVIARSPAPVHLLRQPRQFAAAADLIDAVHQLGLCDIVRAFPGGFDRQGMATVCVPVSVSPVRSMLPLCLAWLLLLKLQV